MKPELILPIFLGVCVGVLCIWNVRVTGDLTASEKTIDNLADSNVELLREKSELEYQVERLLDDVTKLASQAQKRDAHGRFLKKR